MTAPDSDHEAVPRGTRPRRYQMGRQTVLLAALVALLVIPPIIPLSMVGQLVVQLLFSLVAVAAALEIGSSRALLILAGTVAAAAVVAHVASWIWPDSAAGRAAAQLLVVVLFSLLIWRVGRDVIRARVVTADVLRGTVAVYLLLGLSWSFLYRLTNTLDPNAFSMPAVAVTAGSSPGAASIRQEDTFVYFSFVTLTTLGYGDVTPRSGPAQTLAWFEAVVGQLFIAITVARLVALNVAHHREDDD